MGRFVSHDAQRSRQAAAALADVSLGEVLCVWFRSVEMYE